MATNTDAPIEPPKLICEKPGMHLEYDGWRDQVSGRLRGSHSNQNETRIYRFTCIWKRGHSAEIDKFEIIANSEHRDHWLKGTAPTNRKDVRDVMRRVANIWRDEKLSEQKVLHRAIRSQAAERIAININRYGKTRSCVAWWISGKLLLKPKQFGRECVGSWIEVVPTGKLGRQGAESVAQMYSEHMDQYLITIAIKNELSLLEIERVVAARNKGNWSGAKRLMDEMIAARN